MYCSFPSKNLSCDIFQVTTVVVFVAKLLRGDGERESLTRKISERERPLDQNNVPSKDLAHRNETEVKKRQMKTTNLKYCS